MYPHEHVRGSEHEVGLVGEVLVDTRDHSRNQHTPTTVLLIRSDFVPLIIEEQLLRLYRKRAEFYLGDRGCAFGGTGNVPGAGRVDPHKDSKNHKAEGQSHDANQGKKSLHIIESFCFYVDEGWVIPIFGLGWIVAGDRARPKTLLWPLQLSN